MSKPTGKHGFGRLVTLDTRDKNYPLRKILPLKSDRTERYWDSTLYLDQNGYPACVGFGWAHWTNDPPVTHPQTIDPMWLYDEAQKVDGIFFPHEGSTVRAGAQVLQRIGVISKYYWAASVDEIVLALLELGPITVGTNWYTGMMKPDAEGLIKATGAMEGGHCYVLNGVNTVTGMLRIKNSWGQKWSPNTANNPLLGEGGQAFISIADFANIFNALAEGCMATELPVDINPVPLEPVCPYARTVSKIPLIGWWLVRGYRKIRKRLFGIEAGVP